MYMNNFTLSSQDWVWMGRPGPVISDGSGYSTYSSRPIGQSQCSTVLLTLL